MDVLIQRLTLLLVAVAAFLPISAIAQELDQHGKAHDWKGASKEYRLIDFAAAWCQPCWKALPRIQSFADSRPKVRVIVVSVDEQVQGRDKLVKTLGLTIPVLWDEEHRIAEHYRPGGMPATFVLNPAGDVVYQHVGSGDREWKEMIAFIDSALGDR
jgi:peroxiredoxin